MNPINLPREGSPGDIGPQKLASYAWPGGYSIVYTLADGASLCASCANGDNGSYAHTVSDCGSTGPDWDDWAIIGADAYWEGPPMDCAHCGTVLESEYGDPDSPDPSDYVIDLSGHGYSVGSEDNGFLGEFRTMEDALKAIQEAQERDQVWGDIWTLSDHGNLNRLEEI